ncbi:hypothetical protein GOBAR_AA18405 [Gossypium barbadense]|uniref:Uncharacterized protein n=1 Tax=Gossypium barbadense TaxID=3634 RepID=A0A2P5XFZ9_GOSBA|nr:hypothetical protein GOBAR_AA18405 [Gossypium barbadense]
MVLRIEDNMGQIDEMRNGAELENMPIKFVDGKKRQRFNLEVGDSNNNRGMLEDILVKLKELGVRLSNGEKREKGLQEYRTTEVNSRLFEFSNEEINDEVLVEITKSISKNYFRQKR